MKSTRDAYGDVLLKIGENKQIVVVDADLSTSTQTNRFAKKFPDRFINVGCAEQNLIGISAGLAIEGKIVFANTYAIFSSRSWEQIRNTIAYDNLNVKIVVSHSGLTNGPDGASHQSLEDIALMRVIPNMTIIVPCDAIETEKVIISELNRKGPAYIRLNRAKTPIILDNSYEFEIGKAAKLIHRNPNNSQCQRDISNNRDICIISTGTMVHQSLKAAKILKDEGFNVCVLNIHTIKPIDKDSIIEAAKDTKKVLVVEEHTIHGGLGGAVSEILGEEYPVLIKKMGINDKFGESGEYEQLLKKYGLTIDDIVSSAKMLINKKIIKNE